MKRPTSSIPPTVARAGRPPLAKKATPRRSPQDNVRNSAAWVLERTLASHAPVDVYLESALSRFDDRDQGLLTELSLGTLRWLRRIDHVLEAASNRKISEIEAELRAPLRIATYQLLFLDRVPAHAAVHEAVERAHHLTHRGGASFVNGVLRRIARSPTLEEWPVAESDPIVRLAVEQSHPDFLVARWWERFGEKETRALLAANNRPRPLQLLAFRDRGGRELLAERLIDEGLDVAPTSLSPLGLIVRRGNPFATEAFRRGDFYVQDDASQVAALLPPPRAGERIWDVAAAPGGKSFSLLAWEPTVKPFLSDVSPERTLRLASNLRRLGRPLPLFVGDALRSPWALHSQFDRVIVDLPCSGTGTLRKHPEIKWRLSPDEVGRLADRGLNLLVGVAPHVAAGGVLIAITCSLEAEENERTIARFLSLRSEFAPLDLASRLTPPMNRGIVGPGFWRVKTADEHDGFSVHVLEKPR